MYSFFTSFGHPDGRKKTSVLGDKPDIITLVSTDECTTHATLVRVSATVGEFLSANSHLTL
jgi:hypothetical protein